MKTFLIAPVRGYSVFHWTKEVYSLRAEGWQVYWPALDTNQNDTTGLDICLQNKAAMENSDAVHLILDEASQGSFFDLGMAFAMGKKIIPIQLPEPTEGKSFQNMVREYENRNI